MTTQFIYMKNYTTVIDKGVERSLQKHKLEMIQNNAELVRELVTSGIAIEIDNSLYTEYESKIDKLWDDYATRINRIQLSEDPIYDVRGKRSFDINGLRIERDSEIRSLETEYYELIEKRAAELKELDALNTTPVPPADSEKVNQLITRFKSEALFDYNSAKKHLLDAMSYMSESQLVAVQSYLDTISQVANSNETSDALARTFIRSVAEKASEGNPISFADACRQFKEYEIALKSLQAKAIENASKGYKERIQTKLL